ncbi:Hypothetical_protein [Hexamita inflata]|uniref:Hypothetical_protein n=1 Tax=Hexamita inflata TaxID=28002 RepID=A0AA86TXF9_9EUKA|nr:Hypothetical protein HINF_LOCUS20745 [Hexamita inflata]
MLLHLKEAPSEERVNAQFSCAFIGFRALAFLGLFLLGRQVLFSLFQDVFNVLDFVQRFNFLLEYSAMIFRYEISLVERLHNDHRQLDYIFVIFMFAWSSAQFCIVSSSSLHNFFQYSSGSNCSSATICLISLACSSILARLFRFQYFTWQDRFRFDVQFLCLGLLKIQEFQCQSVFFQLELRELAWVRFIEFEIFLRLRSCWYFGSLVIQEDQCCCN